MQLNHIMNNEVIKTPYVITNAPIGDEERKFEKKKKLTKLFIKDKLLLIEDMKNL